MATTFSFDSATADALIGELEQTDDARRLEMIADALGAARDPRATAPLLHRLGGRVVQRDENVEDAVCGALVALEVMRRSSAGRYVFLPEHELDTRVVETIRALDVSIPMRYFLRTTPGSRADAIRCGATELPRCRHGKEGECPYCREHD